MTLCNSEKNKFEGQIAPGIRITTLTPAPQTQTQTQTQTQSHGNTLSHFSDLATITNFLSLSNSEQQYKLQFVGWTKYTESVGDCEVLKVFGRTVLSLCALSKTTQHCHCLVHSCVFGFLASI